MKGFQSINEDAKVRLLIEKLSGIAANAELIPTGNEIMIDLSSWSRLDQLGKEIQSMKEAIQKHRLVSFLYYTNEKLTQRQVEPYQLIFKQSHWYLYAYCLLRNDFRLFKLRRMSKLCVEDASFVPRSYSAETLQWEERYDQDEHLQIVVRFDPVMKYTIDDIFGFENYVYEEDGSLRVTFFMQADAWLYGFLLGFGDKAEILEPVSLREKISNMADSISRVYRKGSGRR